MSECAKIGYSFSGEKPSGYRSTLCDPCSGDPTGETGCCNWIHFNGFYCPEGCLCCPHPTGAILYNSQYGDSSTGADDRGEGRYFFIDTPANKVDGYSKTFSPRIIDLGLISLVDDAGMEYMHEARYANGGGGLDYGNVFRMTISSPMDPMMGEMCSPPCSGGVKFGYWHSGVEVEMTPTPVLSYVVGEPPTYNWVTNWITTGAGANTHLTETPFARDTNDPLWTDTNTAIIQGYRTMTSTAAGQTEGLQYHLHMTSTAAGQTDTSIPGVVQESYKPTPTPSYMDITDTETYEVPNWLTNRQTSATNWVYTVNTIDTEVADSAILHPFLSGEGICGSTSLNTGISGSIVADYVARGDTTFYEPFIGAKIAPLDTWSSSSSNTWIFCTNGTDFKRLGTGTGIVGNTHGDPFSLKYVGGGAGNSIPDSEFETMTGFWPLTYAPNNADCYSMGANKYIITDWEGNDVEVMGVAADGLTDYDPSLSQNPVHTAYRLEIAGLTGLTGVSWASDQQIIWHPTYRHQSYADNRAAIHPITMMLNPTWGPWANHMWHGCHHYGAPTELRYMNMNGNMKPDGGGLGNGGLVIAYSQKSFLDSVNNWVASKLGAGWRVARANEIIKDYIPPRNSCRMVQTHEEPINANPRIILNVETEGGNVFHAERYDGLQATAGESYTRTYDFWSYEDCGPCSGYVPNMNSAGDDEKTFWDTPVNVNTLWGYTSWETYDTWDGSLTTHTDAGGAPIVGTTFRETLINLNWTEKLTTTADYGTHGTSNPVGVTPTPVPTPPHEARMTAAPAIGTNTHATLGAVITGYEVDVEETWSWKETLLENLGNDIGVMSTRVWSDWCIFKRGCEASSETPLGFFGPTGESHGCKTCNESAFTRTERSLCYAWDYVDYSYAGAWAFHPLFHQPGAVWVDDVNLPIYVANNETAISLGSIWNTFVVDEVPNSIPKDITSWTHNPEGFYHTSKSNYDKSRCCDGGKPYTGDWCGIPCLNLKSGNYCYSGEEINVNLGTGTGTFIGVVGGGAYWDDVVQTGISDEEVSGNTNSQYSLGYGLMYPSGEKEGALMGQTDNGDSRYLRSHIKTYTGDLAAGDPLGNSGESGHATFVYALKVYEGTQVAAGSGLVTCPGRTGDAECYASSNRFLRSGESGPSGGENVTWGSGGKTYIKGLISPSGGCPEECGTRTGIAICYAELEGGSYSGFESTGSACTEKCESGSFIGWFTHNPSSRRGYTEVGEWKIPKNGATVYSGESGSASIETKGEGYYYVENDKHIQISSDGKVTAVGDCRESIGDELEFIANGDNWTQSDLACEYPNASTLSASMIFTGNGGEVSLEQEDCNNFYMPAVGVSVRVADYSEGSLPDGSYYYGIACVQEPTMVGYYAQLNMTNGSGVVTATGRCESPVVFYKINISYPDWSDVDGVVGWPSSGTLCNLGYSPAVPPWSPHSEFGTYTKVLYTHGYCTGALSLPSSAKVPIVPDSHGENVIRKTPSVDGEPLFSQPGPPLWYECSYYYQVQAPEWTGSTEWGSHMFRASATSFANKSGQCVMNPQGELDTFHPNGS